MFEVALFFAAGLVGEFQHIGFAVPQQHTRFGGAGFADLGFVLLGGLVVAGGGKIGDALAEGLCFFVKLPCELLSDFQAAFGLGFLLWLVCWLWARLGWGWRG